MGEDNQGNMNTKDFVIGTLVGGIVGAAAALLLAPKSGKEIRHDINEQAQIAKIKTSNIRSSANEYAEQALQKSTDFAKVVSEQSSQVMDRVKEVSNNVKEDVKSLRQRSEDLVEETENEQQYVEISLTNQKQNDETQLAEEETESTKEVEVNRV